jgi:hypothetical protein
MDVKRMLEQATIGFADKAAEMLRSLGASLRMIAADERLSAAELRAAIRHLADRADKAVEEIRKLVKR